MQPHGASDFGSEGWGSNPSGLRFEIRDKYVNGKIKQSA